MKGMPDSVTSARREIAEMIAQDMETKGLSWSNGLRLCSVPHNPISGTRYRGGNYLHAVSAMMRLGTTDPRFVTFNQAKKAGMHVKRGERAAATIERWRRFTFSAKADEREDEPSVDEGDLRSILRCVGSFPVFHASQVEGMPDWNEPNAAEHAPADLAIGAYLADHAPVPVTIDPRAESPYYAPNFDRIVIQPIGAYEDAAMFCSNLLHEAAHSTAPRLGRSLTGAFGSEKYAHEELIAEISSVMSGVELGIDGLTAGLGSSGTESYENHIAYLQSWIKAIRDDPDVLFRAAAAASDCTDYLMENCYSADEVAAIAAQEIECEMDCEHAHETTQVPDGLEYDAFAERGDAEVCR